MGESRILKQTKPRPSVSRGFLKQSTLLPTWLGGILTQLQMSLMYVGMANIFMLAITMWYTKGADIVQRFMPSFEIYHFLLLLVLGWATVMLVDFKYLTPVRTRFLNRQTSKHKNPVFELLEKVAIKQGKMEKDIAKIKKELNIGEVDNGVSAEE